MLWSSSILTWKAGRPMGDSVKPLNMDQPAELSFSEKGNAALSLTDIIRFEHLSTALIFAVRTMHSSHRPNCRITTQSGNIYRWGDIPALYDTVKLMQ